MNQYTKAGITDEQLNGFIDDELSFEERERVYEALNEDDALNHEAHELRQLRALLRHAYRTPPAAPLPPREGEGRKAGFMKSLAAGLLLTTGALSGWVANDRLATTPTLAANNAAMEYASATIGQDNLLLHISSSSPERMDAALSYAERILAQSRETSRDFRLEVVANDGGVELLRRDTSPFPERIEALLSNYDNVSFLACANALEKLRERGVKVELLPGTRSDHTAIDEIVDRLEGGWRYLKV